METAFGIVIIVVALAFAVTSVKTAAWGRANVLRTTGKDLGPRFTTGYPAVIAVTALVIAGLTALKLVGVVG